MLAIVDFVEVVREMHLICLWIQGQRSWNVPEKNTHFSMKTMFLSLTVCEACKIISWLFQSVFTGRNNCYSEKCLKQSSSIRHYSLFLFVDVADIWSTRKSRLHHNLSHSAARFFIFSMHMIPQNTFSLIQ